MVVPRFDLLNGLDNCGDLRAATGRLAEAITVWPHCRAHVARETRRTARPQASGRNPRLAAALAGPVVRRRYPLMGVLDVGRRPARSGYVVAAWIGNLVWVVGGRYRPTQRVSGRLRVPPGLKGLALPCLSRAGIGAVMAAAGDWRRAW